MSRIEIFCLVTDFVNSKDCIRLARYSAHYCTEKSSRNTSMTTHFSKLVISVLMVILLDLMGVFGLKTTRRSTLRWLLKHTKTLLSVRPAAAF